MARKASKKNDSKCETAHSAEEQKPSGAASYRHTQTVINDIKIETHPPAWGTLIIWIQLASYAQCAEQIYI